MADEKSSNNVDMKIADGIFVVAKAPNEEYAKTNFVYFSEFGGEKRGLAMFQSTKISKCYHYECDEKSCGKGEVVLNVLQRELLGVDVGDEIHVRRAQFTSEEFKLARIDLSLALPGEGVTIRKREEMPYFSIEENGSQRKKEAPQKCANASRLLLKIKDVLLKQEVLFVGEPILISESDPKIVAFVSGLYVPHPIKILGDSSVAHKERLHRVKIGIPMPGTKILFDVMSKSKLRLTGVPMKTPTRQFESGMDEFCEV